MVKKTLKIKNKLGLHARPAALFVQVASKFAARVKVLKDDQEVDGKSIMGLMALSAEYGSDIVVTADGEDENILLEKISELIDEGFHEE